MVFTGHGKDVEDRSEDVCRSDESVEFSAGSAEYVRCSCSLCQAVRILPKMAEISAEASVGAGEDA